MRKRLDYDGGGHWHKYRVEAQNTLDPHSLTGESSRTSPPPRLLPDRPLPPYSYVTGKAPHPLRDPAGHSYGVDESHVAIPSPVEWRRCTAYLWGIDLFNRGYYWEAHESWEAVWNAAGRQGPLADFCKALIKLAAAGVKAREGRANGVKRHARAAKALLGSVAGASALPRFMGLSLPALEALAEQLILDPDAVVDTRAVPVAIVMPSGLEPAAD